MASNIITNCPWSCFKQSEIDFCENNLCSWVVEPANSWSCVAYVIVGIYILYYSNKNRIAFAPNYFGYIAILIGVFSVAYHATLTFVGSLLDLSSMYFLLSNIIYIIIERFSTQLNIKWLKFSGIGFWFFNGILLLITFLFESITGILYLGLVISILTMEIALIFLEKNRVKNYRWLQLTCSLYVISSVFWYFDTYRVFCFPENHWINGHVLWHFGSAICILTIFMHYQQFLKSLKN